MKGDETQLSLLYTALEERDLSVRVPVLSYIIFELLQGHIGTRCYKCKKQDFCEIDENRSDPRPLSHLW